MDKFLEIIGLLIVVVTLFLMVAVVKQSGDAVTLVLSLSWAVPAIIGGVILAAFGSMLGQLKAIRANSEKQTELFQSLLDRSRNKS
ncbi:MAG: hypothetical protein QHC90_25765 [Shinella sp.]|nr:hypothetical protein [Shinella sp.]